MERLNVKNDYDNKLKKEFKSKSSGVFIGWHGYPEVFAGILTPYKPIKQQSVNDWVNNNSSINDVMNYRTSLINSHDNVNIKELKGFNELIQQSALSNKQLSVDVALKQTPKLRITFNLHAQPYGPGGEIKELIINDEPSIKRPVNNVFTDTDLKANEAISYLNQKRLPVDEISALLSAGTIGVGNKRKLVPTRWSITATDDSLGKEYINNIKNNDLLTNYKVFNGRLMGNTFTILLMPGQWSYELFELWQPGAVFANNETQVMTDHEEFNGRKTYASNCGGGYYASRLPITKWLSNNKLQASALVIRRITKDYYMPLGVWVVREAVRKALLNCKEFNDYALARTYVERLTGFDLRQSRLITNKQTTLNKFMEQKRQ
jgi:hypothetical protein